MLAEGENEEEAEEEEERVTRPREYAGTRRSPWPPCQRERVMAFAGRNTLEFHGPYHEDVAVALEEVVHVAVGQGLTLFHFSAQLEPCLTQEITLHTLNTPLTRATRPLRAPPIPYKALKLS